LQQVIKRYAEKNQYEGIWIINHFTSLTKFKLKTRHASDFLIGEIQDIVELEYKKVILLENYKIGCSNEANN